jgi:hypothetical protein
MLTVCSESRITEGADADTINVDADKKSKAVMSVLVFRLDISGSYSTPIEDGVHDSLCGYVSDVAPPPKGFHGIIVEPFKPSGRSVHGKQVM